MSENICYLCQEPKSVVGHNTQTCPSVKCKKCGQKGHIIRNCPYLKSNLNPKPDDACPKETKSENSVFLKYDTKIIDFIYQDIGCCDEIKPQLEINREKLQTQNSGKDQRSDKVDSIIYSNKESMDSIHNIKISNDIKPKLEIEKEPINCRGIECTVNLVEQAVNKNLKGDIRLTFFTSSLPKITWAMHPLQHDLVLKESKSMKDFKDKEEGMIDDPEERDEKSTIQEPLNVPMELDNNDQGEKNYLDIEGSSLLNENELKKKFKLSQFDCVLCYVKCSSQLSLNIHINGLKHKRKLKMSQKLSQFYCKICDAFYVGQTGLEMHLAGKWHSKNKLKVVNSSTNDV